MADIDAQNKGVRDWASTGLKEIKSSYNSKVGNRTGAGLKSLRFSTGKSFGEINRISFGLNRYLVFVHKGAGKGKGGAKGSSWINPTGKRVFTSASSLGKMNTGDRQKKEFLNPVLDKQIPKLADVVAGFKADQVVKAIKIK